MMRGWGWKSWVLLLGLGLAACGVAPSESLEEPGRETPEALANGGTCPSAVRLADFSPGGPIAGPFLLTAVKETLYFTVDDGITGRALWASDGTPDGTRLFRDFGSTASQLTEARGLLFFVVDRTLWRTDGTTIGTFPLVTAAPPPAFFTPVWILGEFRGRLFFMLYTPEHGRELWVSDGTPGGTGLIRDAFPGPNLEGGQKLTAAGKKVFFEAFDPVTGSELWVSREGDAGTYLVKDIFRGDGGAELSNLRGVGNSLYFAASDGLSGQELWKSDGTPEGTVQVMDIAPGPANSAPHGLTRVGLRLFFFAWSPSAGEALWSVDLCDREPPLLECPSDMVFEATSFPGTPVRYSVTATDDLTDEPQLEYSHPPGTAFPVGSTAVSVQARDEAGNVSVCTFQVTMRDSAAPALTCPRGLLVDAASAEGTVVDYPEVKVLDTASQVSLVYEPPEGTLFPAGESTRVTVTATDQGGNKSTCQFNVTVEPLPTPEDVGCGCGAHPGSALGWGSLLLLLALTRLRRPRG